MGDSSYYIIIIVVIIVIININNIVIRTIVLPLLHRCITQSVSFETECQHINSTAKTRVSTVSRPILTIGYRMTIV